MLLRTACPFLLLPVLHGIRLDDDQYASSSSALEQQQAPVQQQPAQVGQQVQEQQAVQEQEACKCQPSWAYDAGGSLDVHTNQGCSPTADTDYTWCYVVDASGCSRAQKSVFHGELRQWRKCDMGQQQQEQQQEPAQAEKKVAAAAPLSQEAAKESLIAKAHEAASSVGAATDVMIESFKEHGAACLAQSASDHKLMKHIQDVESTRIQDAAKAASVQVSLAEDRMQRVVKEAKAVSAQQVKSIQAAADAKVLLSEQQRKQSIDHAVEEIKHAMEAAKTRAQEMYTSAANTVSHEKAICDSKLAHSDSAMKAVQEKAAAQIAADRKATEDRMRSALLAAQHNVDQANHNAEAKIKLAQIQTQKNSMESAHQTSVMQSQLKQMSDKNAWETRSVQAAADAKIRAEEERLKSIVARAKLLQDGAVAKVRAAVEAGDARAQQAQYRARQEQADAANKVLVAQQAADARVAREEEAARAKVMACQQNSAAREKATKNAAETAIREIRVNAETQIHRAQELADRAIRQNAEVTSAKLRAARTWADSSTAPLSPAMAPLSPAMAALDNPRLQAVHAKFTQAIERASRPIAAGASQAQFAVAAASTAGAALARTRLLGEGLSPIEETTAQQIAALSAAVGHHA